MSWNKQIALIWGYVDFIWWMINLCFGTQPEEIKFTTNKYILVKTIVKIGT